MFKPFKSFKPSRRLDIRGFYDLNGAQRLNDLNGLNGINKKL
jgi:hypothetical protein